VTEIEAADRRAALRRLDLLELDDVPRVIADLAEELGGLDAFVNNAATGHDTPVLELGLAEWNRVLDVDLTGAFVAAQAAARLMVERGTEGRIVNVTSVHEHIPKPGSAAYCAAKGGLGLLTKVMALELAEHAITVNSIAPGEISTPMTDAHDVDPTEQDRPQIPVGRPGHSREIASAVVYLCSPGASYTTGASLIVDGGLVLIPAAVN
jgi:NAD(P)-dependent dehydrogenase (short-subunit alcohol dehydrogenase family)